MTAIHRAVKTLRVSRQPKGVKPEEVEPGGLYRFESDDAKVVRQMLWASAPPGRYWIKEDGHLMLFHHADRIIPIDPEEGEGCGHVCHLEGNALGRAYCPKCGKGLTEPIDPEDS